MEKARSLGRNAVLNVIRTVMPILFALLAYRHVMPLLGTEGMGKVAFGHSWVIYFTLLAMLGVDTYAVREGARRREDPADFARFADEVFTLNLIFTALAYLLLGLALLFLPKLRDYRLLILLQSLSILFVVLRTVWLNTVFEDYGFLTVLNVGAQLFALALLYVLVRSEADYYWYAASTVAADGIVCVVNRIYCRRYWRPRLTARPNFKAHLRPMLILFANALTISIYVNFDTTMLGWMTDDRHVGLYDQAVKVYNVLKQVMSAVYMVTVARLTFFAARKDFASYKTVFTRVCGSVCVLLLPVSVGVMCLSKEIVLFLGGPAFLEAVSALRILSLSLIFAIFGGLVTACLNITLCRERENLIATLLGAALNVALNFLFIPWLAQNGAAITTALSELFVFLFCWLRLPNKESLVDRRAVGRGVLDALLGSALVAALSFAVHRLLPGGGAAAGLILFGSIGLYALLLAGRKDPFFCEAVSDLRGRLKR